MKCERCNATTQGHELFDYCSVCSRNLCSTCMREARCPEAMTPRSPFVNQHVPANHGDDVEVSAAYPPTAPDGPTLVEEVRRANETRLDVEWIDNNELEAIADADRREREAAQALHDLDGTGDDE